jgi:anaerobic selenocysteine-containing dehydrogenase
VKRTICTHCSVGCSIDAVVQNGVWIRQEPVFDSPLNLGAHCAKGASIREHGIAHDSHRLKYPMKLSGGKWQKISWDQAYDEISKKMLDIRKESGPDALFVVGSSKHSNEQSELLCKWVRLWGTNNTDHQARICHSTTVSGVAQTWGYGAMTNSYNDEQNSKSLLFFGSNAAEAHPVSMLHTLHAKESGCKVIVADPRFTRTAAKADLYVRTRSGGDVAFLFGVLHHVFKNGWEDKEYIRTRVYGMDQVKKEVMEKWTPANVTEACGVPEAEVYQVAKILAENRPGFIIWAMGQTQHTNANAIVRASNILMLALGNVGRSGGGCNIYRGHDNVQGATDVGPNPDTLPGYYPVAVPGLVGALGQGLERRPRVADEAVRLAGDDGQARHDGIALDRRRDGEERRDRPGLEPARGHLLGTCAELADARPRHAEGDGEARPDGRGRSVPVGERGDVRQGAQGRRLPAAGRDADGMRGLGDGVEPLAAVAREGDRADVRFAHRPHDHVSAGGQARLRRSAGRQEGRQADDPAGERQGRRGAVDRGHPAQ